MTKKRDNPFYFNELFDSGILANLSPADALVYLAYVRYTNGGDDSAFPSQEKLSKNLGIAIRTVRRAIKKLSDLGYIKQVSSGKGKNSNKSNVFDVIMPSQLGFSKSATQAPVPPTIAPDSTTAEQTTSQNPYSLTPEQKLKASGMVPAQPYYTLELQDYYNNTVNIAKYFPTFEDLLDYIRLTSSNRRLGFTPLWKEIRPELESRLT